MVSEENRDVVKTRKGNSRVEKLSLLDGFLFVLVIFLGLFVSLSSSSTFSSLLY